MAISLFSRIFLFGLPVLIVICQCVVGLAGGVSAAAKLIILKCPFYLLTDLLCPTCGLGRSLIASFSGQFVDAIGYHPAGLLVFFISIYIWIHLLLGLPFKKDIPKLKPQLLWTGIVLYSVWGFSRNLI